MIVLGLFSKKSGSLLGIDISATSVTLLALSHQGRSYRVEAYAREDLASDPFGADPEALARVLSRAWLKSGSRRRDVAVAVSGEAVISKLIEMPAGLGDDELEHQLQLEAAQYIPYPLEDVAIDFEVQGAVPGDPRRVQVLLVACRNEDVEALEAPMTLAGLTPRVVDTMPLALQRCLAMLTESLPSASPLAVALLDIGADMTTFCVMHGQRIIYSREQLFGSRQLTQALERRYTLTLDQALLAERQGCLPQGCAEDTLRPFEQALLQQAHRSLQLFAESPQQLPVERLLLAGDGSRLTGLDGRLAEQVGIVTVIADPFVSMSIAPHVDARALAEQAPYLLRACGLALRGFD